MNLGIALESIATILAFVPLVVAQAKQSQGLTLKNSAKFFPMTSSGCPLPRFPSRRVSQSW